MTVRRLIMSEEGCWGCMACLIACKQEHALPEGINLISITPDGPKKENGKFNIIYRIKSCIHCDDPPCVDACPENAINKREDSIVVLDDDSCTGCGTCIDECPYGAIIYDEANNRAIKCNMCHHRIDMGLLPACADNICLGHCIHLKENRV